MAWIIPKRTDYPYVRFHFVDLYADIGNSAKGTNLPLNVLGVQPVRVYDNKAITKVGGSLQKGKATALDFHVKFLPFSVELSTKTNDFSDYLLLTANMDAYEYTVIIYCNLSRSNIGGEDYWKKKTTDLTVLNTPRIVVAMEMPDPNPQFENGTEEISITFRQNVLYNPV